VYQIVQQHHGHITCESSPGEGTVFTITWPVCQQQLAGDLMPII
jgi:signal transduction histidine kinase